MFIFLSVENSEHNQNAKCNDCIQQLALKEVIYILKAGLVYRHTEMPITCSRRVIYADIASLFMQA